MNTNGRILCVTSNFPRWPGDSTTPFVLNLAEDLAALGWQVDVLAPHAPGARVFERFDRVDVYRFRYIWPESQQTVCYQGGALVNLRKNPWNRLKLPALVGAQFLAMLWRLLRGNYDVIHAHWLLPQGFNAVLLGRLLRKPVVITVHGGDVFGLRGSMVDRFKRLALAWASCVTVNSDFTGAAVRALGTTPSRLLTIPMGVSIAPLSDEETGRVKAIREEHRQPDAPLVLFVGRLVDEKGVPDLLDAVALLVDEMPGLRLLVAGEGQDRAEFEARAASRGITTQVRFLGWVATDEVKLYMAAADIFVGPSRTAVDGWVEAQGLTILEAMSSGAVTVGTRLGGIKESIVDGESGFLVDERASEQIAGVIRQISGNAEPRERMARAARARVRERFSREASAQAFSEVFCALGAQPAQEATR